jgi:hypothetical protein
LLPALILVPANVDVDVSGSLTLGDLIVGAGTLLLAIFTGLLARETRTLDRETATRERQRQERQVRGVAVLVDGELSFVIGTIRGIINKRKYEFFLPMPRGAWDRDGALLVEALTGTQAVDLVVAYARLSGWQANIAEQRRLMPGASEMNVPSEVINVALLDLYESLNVARRHVFALAYPGESVPDTEPVTPPTGSEPPGDSAAAE